MATTELRPRVRPRLIRLPEGDGHLAAVGYAGLELTAWIRPLKGFLNSPPIFGSTLTVELNKQQKRVPTILPHKGKQSSTV